MKKNDKISNAIIKEFGVYGATTNVSSFITKVFRAIGDKSTVAREFEIIKDGSFCLYLRTFLRKPNEFSMYLSMGELIEAFLGEAPRQRIKDVYNSLEKKGKWVLKGDIDDVGMDLCASCTFEGEDELISFIEDAVIDLLRCGTPDNTLFEAFAKECEKRSIELGEREVKRRHRERRSA